MSGLLAWLAALLKRLLAFFAAPKGKTATLTFQPEGGTPVASIEVQSDSAPLSATVSFLDAEGNPTTADDVPAWSSSDDAVAFVTSSPDGLQATVEIGGPGAAIIAVHSVNDDGSFADAQGTVTVLAGDAVIGEVTFTETAEPAPVEEPPAEEPPAEEPVA